MRRECIFAAHFWEVHGQVAGIVVDRKDVESILVATKSWLSVSEPIKRVVNELLFGGQHVLRRSDGGHRRRGRRIHRE